MTDLQEETRTTAYALGELSPPEKEGFEAELADSEALRAELADVEATVELVRAELRRSSPELGEERRERIRASLKDESPSGPAGEVVEMKPKRRRRWVMGLASIAAVLGAGVLFVGARGLGAGDDLDARASLEEREFVDLPAAAPKTPTRPSPLSKRKADMQLGHGIVAQERELDREQYDHLTPNAFTQVSTDPRSTFSIDVDTASYSLIRRHLNEGRRLPKGAVRIEEMINYFDYAYPEPTDGRPFSVTTDVATAPWAPKHRLMRIGLKGKHIVPQDVPGTNLVFLLDVSGSMMGDKKLPLLKRAFSMFVEQLDERDRVSIVVYAGASGVVLPPTSGNQKETILSALDGLQAGGSTNGGAGIQRAYDLARESFIEGGINRVMLATDGDFNVGTTSQSDLIDLIQQKAKSGVFLSVLGFGGGNYNDSTLEKIADKGNGNYAYIDSLGEARKVLVEQATGTLMTIAKDVKIQVEFNPAEVAAYRLIGYENRVLAHRDFEDDKKDAGEIGADHTVTALYEIVPAGQRVPDSVPPLRYQKTGEPTAAAGSGEAATVKLRYKLPDADTSQLMEVAVRDSGAETPTGDFAFAAAVAELGMLLRDSPHKGAASYEQVLELAGSPTNERRRELVGLVRRAMAIGK